jgi:endonuclease-3
VKKKEKKKGGVVFLEPPGKRAKVAKPSAAVKKRAAKIVRALKKAYPDARCSLHYSSPLELLVATMLSAQCTDVRVNIVTKDLFEKCRSAVDYANIPQHVLEEAIRSTGFFRNKAKSIRGAAVAICEDFGGKVPDTMEGLLSLPGVARKTANVVLGNAFGRSEGIVVDTHVTRLARRLGLTRRKNNQGDRIERDLLALLPRSGWTLFSHLLISHGREVCTARKPDCDGCVIKGLCPSAFEV